MNMNMHPKETTTENIAMIEETDALETTCLQVTLPNDCDQRGSWVAKFKNYPAPFQCETTPVWLPFSREASHEKKIQLTTPEDLIEGICQDLLENAGPQFDPATTRTPYVDMPEDSWPTAVAILHVARTRPSSWDDMIRAGVLERLSTTGSKADTLRTASRKTRPERCEEVERAVRVAERQGDIPFFARKVIAAWRTLMRQRRKRSSQLRDGPVVAAVVDSAVLPCCFSSKSLADLPPVARFTPAANEELDRVVAAVTARPSVLDESVEDLNEQQFDRIRALAREIAQQKGSRLVHYRDVRRSAEILDTNVERKDKASPAEETPEHIDEVVDKLSALKAEQLRLSRGGIAPPKVLVMGESGSKDSPPFVAKMFQDAGADVATCDLKESTATGIPHFRGDAANIQDLGWDLVIGHPPCTFLSNASIRWLKNDPERRRQMYQNAAVFRRFRDAQAPFVAIENSKMGPEARRIVGESPTQYIHPWQHGHGQTKPTALFLGNLPPITPTRIVHGRAHSLARYPPDIFRTEKKSKTYVGIAAAMATQWMPVLQRYIQSPYRKRSPKTAPELVAQAKTDLKRVVRLALVDRIGRIRVLASPTPDGQGHDLPERALDDPAQSGQMLKEILTWMEADPQWYRAVEESFSDHPEGHRSFYETSENHLLASRPATLCHLWIVKTPAELCTDDDQLRKGINRSDLKWIPIGTLRTPSSQHNETLSDRYRQSILQYGTTDGWFHPDVHAVTIATEPDPTSASCAWRQPWLVDHEDLPPPPPTPRHIRRRHGKWRVWDVVGRRRGPEGIEESGDAGFESTSEVRGWRPSDLLFEWQTLPARLGNALDQHLGLPFKPLPQTMEAWTEDEDEDLEEKGPQTGRRRRDVAVARGPTPMDLSSLRSVSWSAPEIKGHGGTGKGSCTRGVEAWCNQHRMKIDSKFSGQARELWDQNVKAKREQQFGLGVITELPPKPRNRYPPRQAGLPRLVRFIRNEHAKFVPGGRNPDPNDPESPKEVDRREEVHDPRMGFRSQPEHVAHVAYDQWVSSHSRLRPEDPHYLCGFRIVPTQDVGVVETDALPEPDGSVALTPSLGAYAASALYVKDFRVKRREPISSSDDLEGDILEVHHAVMPSGKVLADTGAAPSVITTQMLEKLPKNSCVSRDVNAKVGRLNGANGNALITFGTATIDFELGETPCRHQFSVIQGRPLLLLGNDFLAPRKAQIQLNSDDKGGGTVKLSSQNVQGDTITHGFNVTTRTGSSSPLCPVTMSATPPADTNSPPEEAPRRGEAGGILESLASPPQKPEALVEQVMGDSEWKLESSEYLLYTTTPVVIPPRSRITIRVRAPRALIEKDVPVTCLVDRIYDWNELSGLPKGERPDNAPPVVTRLATISEGQVDVQLVNGTRRKVSVAGFSPIAKLDAEYYVRGCVDLDRLKGTTSRSPRPTEPDLADHQNFEAEDPVAQLSTVELGLLDSMTLDPEGRLTEEQRTRVRRLVADNITAFATDPKCPTKTHLMEVELPLKPDATPHRHAASRVGEEGRQVIEKHIEEMESRGIIRKSNSEWGSRVVLVTKKDGSVRFCVDYRDLNSKLKLQDSPIPLTMEALDRLSSGEGCASSLFLSTLDLASGFWTLPVKEEDKALTAFVTHRQKYEFNYLPFGIQSGPSYMVRLMDAALQGLAWETCMPYLDDVGVWSTGTGSNQEERESNSFEQMMSRLQSVFQRLRWAGLSMKASKCVLFATKAEYLGHVVSREGLRMDPRKIEVVRNFEPTEINTVTKVRSFLGICSYYRRFIEGFSLIAAPLTDLTRDGVDVEVESQKPGCQAAFQRLIKAITSEPVLCTPRFDRQFVVKTDAANQIGLGGVLSQADDNGRERVVAYHGRRLTKHERNYTVTEIELLAAVDSIRHWRPYLWGRAFKLVVDHSALRWLHTMRDTMEGGPASRLMRWILKLAEYRFHVEHKPGVLHKDADAISRLVTDSKGGTDPSANDTPREDCPSLLGDEARREDDCGEEMTISAVTSAPIGASKHRNATARSVAREQREKRTPEEINASYLATGAPSLRQIQLEQGRDSECQEMVRFLQGELDDIENDNDVKRLARTVRRLTSNRHNQRNANGPGEHISTLVQRIVLEDGILYRVLLTPDSTDEQPGERVPYVPLALRIPLMAAFHERMGHASKDRVAAALRRRYFWPKLTQDVADHVADCHECTLAKTPNVRNRNPVGPTVGRYPFDLVYADILDMADTYDYNADTGSGYRKLAVFVDSLSRWAEAIPLHKEPTAAELLDVFTEYVVARHGVPRILVSDRGSNLVSALNREIFRLTGVTLHGTAAEHKEANGVVERFNQTLLNMTRASDLGGAHWRDHLPFILMAYRATPHRVTKESPSMLLYGREMRPPAQIGDPHLPPATVTCEDPNKEIQAYATRLHNRLVYAWQAAYGATRKAQGTTVSNTAATSVRGQRNFQVGDRVVRRLYGKANSLEAKYAGPYRIAEVLGKGRYKLRDLENKLIFDEFDISNLRLYTTPTEEEPLGPDEYIVEKLLARRWVDGQKQYRVKYRGYSEKQSLWTSSEELSRRCQGMMDDFDGANPDRRRTLVQRKRTEAAPVDIRANPHSGPPPTASFEETGTHLPEVAQFMRGRWHYGRKVRDRRTARSKVVWKNDSHYTASEIESELFAKLRDEAGALAQNDPDVAAVFNQLTSAFETKAFKAEVAHDLSPAAIPEEPDEARAVSIWFVTNDDILAFERPKEGSSEVSRLDTIGGDMIAEDKNAPHKAALRILRHAVTLPASWEAPVQRALAMDPEGQDRYRLIYPHKPYKQVVLWYVRLSGLEAEEKPLLIQRDPSSPSAPPLQWRSHGDAVSNLSNFPSLVHLGRSMGKWIVPLSAPHSME